MKPKGKNRKFDENRKIRGEKNNPSPWKKNICEEMMFQNMTYLYNYKKKVLHLLETISFIQNK